MSTLRYKLFGIGKLPEALRAAIEPEGMLHVFEGVPAHFRFAGSVPGLRSAGETRTYSGALALTRRRMLATVSVVPHAAGRVVDAAWHEAPTTPIVGAESMRCGGPVLARLDTTGLHVELDVSRVDASFSGQLTLHFELTFTPAELAELPAGHVAFAVPADYVLRLTGVAG